MTITISNQDPDATISLVPEIIFNKYGDNYGKTNLEINHSL